MRAARASIAALLALAALAAVAVPSATATPGLPWVLTGSFDGSATPDGSFQTQSIGVNQAAGRVLVVDKAHTAVIQLDESGNPVNFSALGSPKLSIPSYGEIAVDNSGGPTQGNFYILHQGSQVEGYSPAGTKLAGWPVLPNSATGGTLYSITVDPDGDVWLGYFGGTYIGEELTAGGTPTGSTIPLTGAKYFSFCSYCQQMAFDSHKNIYYTVEDGGMITRRSSEGYANYFNIKGQLVSTDVAVDPSTADAYFNHDDNIAATKYTEPYEEKPPYEILPGLNSFAMEFSGDGQTLFATEEGTKINVFKRQLPEPPAAIAPVSFTKVKSESAFVAGLVDTGGGAPTDYYFEYGTDTSYGHRYPVSGDYHLPHTGFGPQGFTGLLEGLKPDTIYHVRYVVTNASGTGVSADAIIKTLPAALTGEPDTCANALARKQTGASALADCRAYELVSAPYTGGYDVEAPMVPGQKPFGGYPDAEGRVLYGVHGGVVPGPWNPTNRGVDPYVAVRGADGWSTEYVGLPADLSPDKSSFSSVLGEADAGLHTFAFAGPGLCDPCFEESPETGIPLRNGGGLTQAMAGDNVPSGNQKPEGQVRKMLSADGRHLVFGSMFAFTPGANSNGTDLNVFDRDLSTGTTQLVSTTPAGNPMQVGSGVSELAMSGDGSRILIGERVGDDAAGNEYARLYLHIGSQPKSIELTPGFTQGALFAGMAEDGSKVFFTSREKLLPADTDSSADLYLATVGPAGTVSLELLTPNAGGSCNPPANEAGPHWNTVDGVADCSAVAIGGGAGVASADGAAYVLSPEQLDGSAGVQDQPNLYSIPSGGNPEFVATLSPDDPVVVGSMHDAAAGEGPEFETSPDGRFATFRSTEALTGVDNAGEPSVFLFDRSPSGGAPPLACPSCNATLTEDPGMKAAATLAGDGLSLTDDGRVFFNTDAPLATEDTNGRRDVYEWVGGRTNLTSSGIGRFDSELLTTTHDGTDAYFFTHDALDPRVDENGERTRIYDARTDGGFFKLPVKPQCAASDECHGPGTEAAGPPEIASSGRTSPGNYAGCPKGKVRRGGKCVKRPHKRHGKRRHTKSPSMGEGHHG